MLMKTAIEDFALYLEAERGYSTLTCWSYRSDLCLLLDFLGGRQNGTAVHEITTQMVRSWIVSMKERGLVNNTIARRVHALRSFWRYLLDTDLVNHDPLRKVSAPKQQRSLPRYLRAIELRALLDTAQKHRDPLIAFRNYAMMAVLIFTGVRRGELLSLRLGDVDLQERLLRVHGKGGKWRVVPLAEEAAEAVSDWLELRPSEKGHGFLFTTSRGNPIYPCRMQRIWRSILERSGIPTQGVTIHTLRHSCATLLLQSGTCDIVQIQQLLGHSRLDTTAIYLHLQPQALQTAMNAHPLSVARQDGGRIPE